MSTTFQTDRVGTASAWILLGVSGGLGLDLCAKAVLERYPLTEFILVRSGFAIVLFLLLAPALFGGLRQLQTRRWRWHLLRTVFAIGAMFGFFYGLARMPLVNALTLGFTAPLMVAALSVPCLGENVGWRRWIAVIAGFVGVLVILRPGSGQLDFATAAILIAAFCYACQAVTARHLGKTESILSLSFYIVVGPFLLASLLMVNDSWVEPDLQGWALMAGAGICSTIAWIGFVNGYRLAAPSILAPIEYLALVGGAIAGFVFWGEVPDRWVLIGALIIVSSGVFVVYRELKTEAP